LIANIAVLVASGLFAIVDKQRIARFDVVETLDDGFRRRRGCAPGSEVPLQVADPEDEIGNDGGARVEFEAEQLVRVDRESGFVEDELCFSELLEGFDDLAFEPLEVFEGNVEEVAAAARRIEDAKAAEFVAEGADRIERGIVIAVASEFHGSGLCGFPVVTQGLDDGGDDEPFDVLARGVVGSEPMALSPIESTFEERSKDGRLNVFPIGFGGRDQEFELRGRNRESFDAFEQATVELKNMLTEDGRKAAAIHGVPQRLNHGAKTGQVSAQALEQAGPTVSGKQMHVFGESGKDASHEEGGDRSRGVLFFEFFREVGKF
jgi:hypothetical protein